MSDKMQEQFEEWMGEYYEDMSSLLCERTKSTLLDCYKDAWQAALASLVVKLPRPSSAVDYGYELNDIQSALTDAGVKYE